MLWKASALNFPTNAGKPKYLSYLSVASNPGNWVIFCLFKGLVLRLKKIEVLLKFNFHLTTI
jgi:hypothetical protein